MIGKTNQKLSQLPLMSQFIDNREASHAPDLIALLRTS